MDRSEQKAMPHAVILREREELSVSGVTQVLCYEATKIELLCTCGRLTVTGKGLRMESLSVECGDVHILGHADGLSYTESRQEPHGLFARLFG